MRNGDIPFPRRSCPNRSTSNAATSSTLIHGGTSRGPAPKKARCHSRPACRGKSLKTRVSPSPSRPIDVGDALVQTLSSRRIRSDGSVEPQIQDEPPLRTDFQRDADRILVFPAFRRLKDKTQIFRCRKTT